MIGLQVGILEPAFGTNYTQSAAVTAGVTVNWSSTATWEPSGVPETNDTVTLTGIWNSSAWWLNSYTITADAGWGADTLNLLSTGGGYNQTFNVTAGAYVRVLTVSNNVNDGGHSYWMLNNRNNNLVLSEFNNIGPEGSGLSFANADRMWTFTNAAQITYHTGISNNLAPHLNFSQATSVNLSRGPTYGAVSCEVIQNQGWGNGIDLGRADNGAQNWTVGEGSHPILRARPAFGTGFIKAGTGDIHMGGVDLEVEDNANNTAISSSGQYNSGIFSGTLTANSLSVVVPSSVGSKFGIEGHLTLDGQAGLQAGGGGNGRAFSAIAGTDNLTVRIGMEAWLQPNGLLEVAPGGGDLYLASTGSGKCALNITAAILANRGNPTVIANTINVAGTNAYISDISLKPYYKLFDPSSIDDNGATMEVRGDFLNQSACTSEFSLAFSTLRCIGPGTNRYCLLEAAGQDLGSAGAGFTNNFAIFKLVVGKDSTGTVSKVEMMLQDVNRNVPGNASPEAVYARTLEVYGNSVVYLKGCPLYYVTGGVWTKAVAGGTAPGDGTGRFRDFPNRGTVVCVR